MSEYVLVDGELYHHGVKGMKWGVRRYQRRDGSLTPAGREHLRELVDLTDPEKNARNKTADGNYEKRVIESRRKFGIEQTDDPNTDILKKNSKMYRLANSDEPIDSKRKYVTITEDDRYWYHSMWEMLGMDYDKPISEFTYKNDKDMRIATGEAVANHILDKYAKKTYKELVNDLKYLESVSLYNVDDDKKITKVLSDKDTEWVENFKRKGKDKIYKTIDNAMQNHLDEITDEFKKRGYDAIVDIEDSKFLSDYPVILLNPNETIKLQKEKPFA